MDWSLRLVASDDVAPSGEPPNELVDELPDALTDGLPDASTNVLRTDACALRARETDSASRGLPDAHGYERGRKLCGLNLPLRLALSAQQAGASRIEVSSELSDLVALLDDPRLRLKVVVVPVRPSDDVSSPGSDVGFRVDVPWNLVVHRDLFKSLIEQTGDAPHTSVRDLLRQPHPCDAAFGFEPIVVRDKSSAKQAERALLRSLRKRQDGWTSTYINRYISLFLSRWLVRTGLRPNQLSVMILVVGLYGAYLASRGDYYSMLIGALLFNAQSVLDGCDGEVARLTYRGSHAGQWFDTVGDDITNYAFFFGLSWGLYTATGWALYLVAGAIVVGCGVCASAIEYRYLIKIGSGDLLAYPIGIGKAPGSEENSGGMKKFVDVISPLFKRDTFVLLTVIGVACGLAGPFLFLFAVAAVGILVAVIRAQLYVAKHGV